MNFFKNPFLLLPFIILFLSFSLDKIILLDSVSAYFSKTLSELNYQHKPELFLELKEYLKLQNRKKVLVYFGNSRALLFDNLYISEKYPDWILFNFSVPGGTPDYFLYWLEKFEKQNIRPNFVLLDHSLEVYNQKPTIRLDEVLLHGVSVPFILKHYDRYSMSEIKNIITKRLFRNYQYRPKWKTAIERMENNNRQLNEFKKLRKEVRLRLQKERGSTLPKESRNVKNSIDDMKRMERLALGDFNSYINPYIYNENMEKMQEDAIHILKKMNIPSALIWVKVSKIYFVLYQNKKVITENKTLQTPYRKWMLQTQKLIKSKKIDFWNMNEEKNYHCEDFSDPGHMSPSCYPEYTNYIFSKITN